MENIFIFDVKFSGAKTTKNKFSYLFNCILIYKCKTKDIMKQKLFSLILFAIFGLLLNTQSIAQQRLVTQVKPTGSDLWGFINLKGDFIIKPQFENCFEFSIDGFAPVKSPKDKQFSFVNIKGEKLVTEVSDYRLINILGFDQKGFSCGLVAINQDKKWGYLNTNGKIAIQVKYDDATEFIDGYATVKLGEKYIVLNTKGEEFVVDDKDVVDVKKFSEELAPFKSSSKLFGFIDKNGKIAVSAQFESVGYFSDGLAWAKTKDGLIGYINPKGDWIIKPQFSVTKNFDEESGLARVKIGEKWAYVNKAGEFLYINDTEDWYNYSNGLAIGKKNKKMGFLNNKGLWIIEPQFEDVREFKNGYAAVKKDDKWGVIDKEGKWIIQPSYSAIKDFELIRD